MDNWILISFFWMFLPREKTAIGFPAWQQIAKNESLKYFWYKQRKGTNHYALHSLKSLESLMKEAETT